MLLNIDITKSQLNQKIKSLKGNNRIAFMQILTEFFVYILNVSHEGNHRVFMERELVLWVNKNIELYKKDKEQLFQVLVNSVKLGDKVKTLPCSLTVSFVQKEFFKRKGYKWNVSYLNFVNGLKLPKIKLLVENEIYDGDFYRQIFQDLANKNDEIGLLMFDPHHGDGKDFMKKLLPRLMNRKEMVLCVCDRDTDYISDDNDNEVMKAYNKKVSDDFLGFVAVTPGREAENFLSLEIFKLMYPQSDTKFLSKLIEIQNCTEKGKCIWLYFDTKSKKGVYLSEMMECCESPDLTKFIQKYLQNKQSKNQRTKFEKFGDNPLKVFVDNSEAQEKFREFIDSNYWQLHFQEWVEPILWYLCGEIPRRT